MNSEKPEQPVASESQTCLSCGAESESDAATKCKPVGDSCYACDVGLWSKPPQPRGIDDDVPEDQCTTAHMLRKIADHLEKGNWKIVTRESGGVAQEWIEGLRERAKLIEHKEPQPSEAMPVVTFSYEPLSILLYRCSIPNGDGQYVPLDHAQALQQQITNLQTLLTDETAERMRWMKFNEEKQQRVSELERLLKSSDEEIHRKNIRISKLESGLECKQLESEVQEAKQVISDKQLEIAQLKDERDTLQAEVTRLKQLPLLDWQPAEVAKLWNNKCAVLVDFDPYGVRKAYVVVNYWAAESIRSFPSDARFARIEPPKQYANSE